MPSSTPCPDTPEPTGAELVAARPALAMHAIDGLVLEACRCRRRGSARDARLGLWRGHDAAPATRGSPRRSAGVDAKVHYAVKANDHLAVLGVFAAQGAGADVVSEGEFCPLARPASRRENRLFGRGQDRGGAGLGARRKVAQINVESADELDMLSAVAAGLGYGPNRAPPQPGYGRGHP